MGARGEGTIFVGEREVQVLFTNRALIGAEKQLGKSALAVAEGFVDGSSGLNEISVLLRAGMEAARQDARMGGKPFSMNDAYDVLDEVGFTTVAAVVMEAVAAVISYSAGGEEEPEPDPNA